MLLASCILDADWWIFHRVLNLKLHADRGKSPGGSSQLPTRLLKRCFVVFLSSTNEKQREKVVVVCVDAPNRPSTRTGLLLFRLEVGHLPSATHWPRAAGGRQRPLGAVCSQKTLLSAFLAVKNTHITLFLCELRVCEERDTTVERATCHLQQADYKELETLRW